MQAYEHNVSVYAELFGVRLHSHFLLVTYGNTPNTVGKDLLMRCFVLYSYSIRALVVSYFSTLFYIYSIIQFFIINTDLMLGFCLKEFSKGVCIV